MPISQFFANTEGKKSAGLDKGGDAIGELPLFFDNEIKYEQAVRGLFTTGTSNVGQSKSGKSFSLKLRRPMEKVGCKQGD